MQNRTDTNTVQLASGLNVIAGILLLISPWALKFTNTQAAMWDVVVCGIIVGVLALIHGWMSQSAVWLSWINVLIGLWLIVSSWVLKVDMNLFRYDTVILGVIVVVLSAWSGLSSTSARTTTLT